MKEVRFVSQGTPLNPDRPAGQNTTWLHIVKTGTARRQPPAGPTEGR